MRSISWKGNAPAKGTPVTLISTGKKVKWKAMNGKTTIELPAGLSGDKANIALAFEFVPGAEN